MKKKFDCEIDCANCAAKVQDAILKMEGVQSAKVNFLMHNWHNQRSEERFSRNAETDL